MTSSESIRITAESTIFMNTRSDEELFAAEHHILEICLEGHVFSEKELRKYRALIVSLTDSAYLTKIQTQNFEERYITTHSGKMYSDRVHEKFTDS